MCIWVCGCVCVWVLWNSYLHQTSVNLDHESSPRTGNENEYNRLIKSQVWKIPPKNYKKTRVNLLTSMLTGSIVLIWTFGAEEERSLWPNWLRWSSSPGRKLCGMGMDLDGDTVGWHSDLEETDMMCVITDHVMKEDSCHTSCKMTGLTLWSQMVG